MTVAASTVVLVAAVTQKINDVTVIAKAKVFSSIQFVSDIFFFFLLFTVLIFFFYFLNKGNCVFLYAVVFVTALLSVIDVVSFH